MTWCPERTRQLAGLVFGGLDPAEDRDARRHLGGCPACEGAVRSTRAMDGTISAALEARARAGGSSGPFRSPAPDFRALAAARRRGRVLRWIAVPAAAAAGVLLFLAPFRRTEPEAPGAGRTEVAEAAAAAAPAVGVAGDTVGPDAFGAAPETPPAPADPAEALVPVAPPRNEAGAGSPASGAIVVEGPSEVGPGPGAIPDPAPAPDTRPAPVILAGNAAPTSSPEARRRLQAARDALATAGQAFERGEWRRAATILRRTSIPLPGTDDPGLLASARRLEGWCALRERDGARARAAFDEALVQCPDDPDAVLGAGASRVHAGAAAEAVPWLKLAAAARPGWASVQLLLGWALLEDGALVEAGGAFAAARSGAPDAASAAAGSAWCLYRLGDAAAAEGAFGEALALLDRKAPGDGRGAVDDGWILAIEEERVRSEGRYAAAAGHGFAAWARGDGPATLRRLEPLAVRRPEGSGGPKLEDEVLETVAWAKLDLGRASAALKDFGRLAARRTDARGRARAGAGQGWCQIALGRKAEARASLSGALALCPGEPAAVEGLDAVEGRIAAGRVPGAARAGSSAAPGSRSAGASAGSSAGTGSGAGSKPMPRGGMGR